LAGRDESAAAGDESGDESGAARPSNVASPQKRRIRHEYRTAD
jgi:hypothetical protein